MVFFAAKFRFSGNQSKTVYQPSSFEMTSLVEGITGSGDF